MEQQGQRPFSNRALRRLAERLRAGDDPTALHELERYKDAHIPTLMRVLNRLYRLPVIRSAKLSARQKNTGTIVEKLRREREMALSRLQDIVGIRIVLQGGLKEQDQVVDSINQAFSDTRPEPRTVDRRSKLSHGYRAVHIIVKVGGYFCEIQVRTPYQDKWAQLFEGLGDRWGRQIRYGQAPDDPHTHIREIGSITRSDVIQFMHDTSAEIAEAESFERFVDDEEARMGVEADELETHALLRRQYNFYDRRRDVHQRFKLVDDFFNALSTVVPSNEHPQLRFEQGATGEDDSISAFLVAYKRSKGLLLEAISLPAGQMESALTRRRELTENYRPDDDVEVVLLAATSESTIRGTHSRYFEHLGELASKKASNDPGT